MNVLGIISSKKDFEIIEKEIIKKGTNVKLIYLNNENIIKYQNIKFDSLFINEEIVSNKDIEKALLKICSNLKYIVINMDKNIDLSVFNKIYLNIITYGLNHKCTINPSSIKEDFIMISVQREILDRSGKIIGIAEKKVKNNINLDIYGNILIFLVEILYKI